MHRGGLGCFLLELPLIIAAGGAAGSVVGGYIGDRADRGLGIGEPPGDVHRAVLAGGTVLAGATIGVLPAGTVTSRVEPEASPDAFRRSAVILSIAGATAGLVYLGVRWDELTGDEKRRVRLAPIYAPDRGPGLVAGIGL